MAEVSSGTAAGAKWTPESDEMLAEACRSCTTWDAVAARVVDGRTVTACMKRAQRLGWGLGHARTTPWTADEDEAIRAQYPEHGSGWPGWAATLPGRRPTQIAMRAKELSVRNDGGCVSGRSWLPGEDETLARLYKEHGPQWSGWARALPGRSHAAIQARAGKLGLARRRAWRDEQDAQLAALARGLGKMWKRRPVDVAERMQIALENERK